MSGNNNKIKELDKSIVLFTENDHEAGMLRIAIPFNTLPTLTKEQREQFILAHLADLIRAEL